MKMKSLLIVFIIITMVAMLVGTGYAKGKVEKDVPLDVVDLKEEDYAERNQELINKGKAKLTGIVPYSAFALNVPHYYQDGQSWSDNIMQTAGDTIGSKGCTVTSFAMIQRFWGGSKDPGQVNTTLGNKACPFYYYDAASKFGYSVSAFSSATQTNSDAIAFIIGALDEGKPVLVGMKKGTSTHFVTAYGYMDNTILINDPESDWDYVNLDQYFNNSWVVNRLCVYAN